MQHRTAKLPHPNFIHVELHTTGIVTSLGLQVAILGTLLWRNTVRIYHAIILFAQDFFACGEYTCSVVTVVTDARKCMVVDE